MTTAVTNLDKFREAYADAVIPDMTDEQWKEASKTRNLNWKGERMSLAEAAQAYATICQGYNEFKPNMIADFAAAFPKEEWESRSVDPIEVTPGRESSVVIYIHVPLGLRNQVRKFAEKNFHADEIDWAEADTLRVWWD